MYYPWRKYCDHGMSWCSRQGMVRWTPPLALVPRSLQELVSRSSQVTRDAFCHCTGAACTTGAGATDTANNVQELYSAVGAGAACTSGAGFSLHVKISTCTAMPPVSLVVRHGGAVASHQSRAVAVEGRVVTHCHTHASRLVRTGPPGSRQRTAAVLCNRRCRCTHDCSWRLLCYWHVRAVARHQSCGVAVEMAYRPGLSAIAKGYGEHTFTL